ncbi:MAG: nucleotidyltransferase domain-containing protein [Chloroflexi bacterium]|nr:nucleotidyltransferase domain-containing protein [Chloroflexota bacterium]
MDTGRWGKTVASSAADLKDPRLAEIVNRLVEALHPERVYLFGSRARGEATPESDYDVLVVVTELMEQPFLLERQAYRVLLGLATPVDVVVMSRERFEKRRAVSASLPATVEREGRLLYAA